MKVVFSSKQKLGDLSTSSDAALVGLASQGNRRAFSWLVSRHQSAVSAVAYGICGDFAWSEDLAQESFITAWKQLNQLKDPSSFRAWVCGISRMLSLNLLRRQQRRKDRGPRRIENEKPEGSMVAFETSPDVAVVNEDDKALLWSSLNRLPPKYREPLVLFYREQQSITAVASALGLSENTVKKNGLVGGGNC